ncbi:hypothetical protein TRICI_005135 [Trichomonascus ciferrii]|uniref:Glycosyl transferase family 25 domain-containing protein n=1 Tax=Trichomonascus ciferrii TaxID=44093 RepID=A0A642UWA7_9ASCO|nr:hypothetical protein TRICI_005135 [Trichomonascus ciferrii]
MNDRFFNTIRAIVFFFLIWQLLYLLSNYKQLTTTFKEKEDAYSSVVNSTLGFNSIQHIKLPNVTNHDRNQHTLTLATGLQRTQVECTFQEDDAGQVSLLLTRLRPHIQLWQEMVAKDIQTMLILETDAIWEESIKEVHWRVVRALNKLLSTSPAENDPYNSDSWDVISFGSCGGSELFSDISVTFDDPDAANDVYFGTPLNRQRVVRRAGYLACTTSYAISQRGAKRMLLRSAMSPISSLDYTMGEMSVAGELDVFSVYPPTFKIDQPVNEN